MRQRQSVVALGGAALVVFCLGAAAQDAGLPEGLHGVLHDRWHQDFYATLRRNDGGGPCCSMTDCRPTQSRKVNGSYEVKLDGAWISVPEEVINHVIAPDGGAHVCAPQQESRKGLLWCVILPPEG